MTSFVIATSLAGALLSYGAVKFPSHAKLLEIFAGLLLLTSFVLLGFCLHR